MFLRTYRKISKGLGLEQGLQTKQKNNNHERKDQ